jgi:hypothetical protein
MENWKTNGMRDAFGTTIRRSCDSPFPAFNSRMAGLPHSRI